jgi:hypothetical protein
LWIYGNSASALMGLVDGHMHLDKVLNDCGRMPYLTGPERVSRIEIEKELRDILPPVAERPVNLVRFSAAQGNRVFQTHVDVD